MISGNNIFAHSAGEAQIGRDAVKHGCLTSWKGPDDLGDVIITWQDLVGPFEAIIVSAVAAGTEIF